MAGVNMPTGKAALEGFQEGTNLGMPEYNASTPAGGGNNPFSVVPEPPRTPRPPSA